ncbi:hypothetical protein EC843_11810 [Buttiauxella sp. JUb87]|nr:hypothetical protein EC843_11810 [Buttiauxella sp. JUb87]
MKDHKLPLNTTGKVTPAPVLPTTFVDKNMKGKLIKCTVV